MVINIASNDKRYTILNEILKKDGYSSYVTLPSEVNEPDVLVLSVRRELSEGELDTIFNKISDKTVVLSGNGEALKKRYKREVIDYSEGEEFLQKNAYLTAESCVSYLHSLSGEALRGKKFFISGYGRIGKHLAKILCTFSEKIFIYARRQEVMSEIENDGFIPLSLDTACECDYVLNTVPYPIFSDTLISKIPKESYLVELASSCGFESTERVSFALGLPGKILPASAARVIYEAILPYLEKERKTP